MSAPVLLSGSDDEGYSLSSFGGVRATSSRASEDWNGSEYSSHHDEVDPLWTHNYDEAFLDSSDEVFTHNSPCISGGPSRWMECLGSAAKVVWRSRVKPVIHRFDPVRPTLKAKDGALGTLGEFKSKPWARSKREALSWKDELFSGVTVALAQLPEAIGFAIIAGVDPLVGLYTASILCFFASLLGGRPGMISGAAGALAVVQKELVEAEGVEYLLAASLLTGLLEMLCGALAFGQLIQLVPYSVLLGFVDGLAIVIGLAQLSNFEVSNTDSSFISGSELAFFLMLVFVTMLVMFVLPFVTRLIPSAFAGIIAATFLQVVFDLGTREVGDVSGDFPLPSLPNVPYSFSTLEKILLPSLTYTAVGLLEAFLTIEVVGDLLDEGGNADQEAVAQGIGNTISALCGGMAGTALIGQSQINVNSGGVRRISGVVAGICVLLIIVAAAPIIKFIPLAALTGVMFMVVLKTFDFRTFPLIFLMRIPLFDSFVVILVTAITVVADLAIAVAAGVALSCIVLAWKSRRRLWAKHRTFVDDAGRRIKVYYLHGPFFFASVDRFHSLLDTHGDPSNVMIDFTHAWIHDSSSIVAINSAARHYRMLDGRLHLKNLNHTSTKLAYHASSSMLSKLGDDHPFQGERLGVGYTRSDSRTCFASGEKIPRGSLVFLISHFHPEWHVVVDDYYLPHMVSFDALEFDRSGVEEYHDKRSFLAIKAWICVTRPLVCDAASPLKYTCRGLYGYEKLRWEDKDFVRHKMNLDEQDDELIWKPPSTSRKVFRPCFTLDRFSFQLCNHDPSERYRSVPSKEDVTTEDSSSSYTLRV